MHIVTMDRVAYRYPIFRFFSWFSIIIIIDMLASLFLWLGEMDETRITSSVEDFDMVKSVFDLACIAVGRCIILIPILASLENMTISASQNGVENGSKRSLFRFLSGIIVLGGIVYTIFKGVNVIKNYNDKTAEHVFKGTDYALCISAFVFSLLYLLLLVKYVRHLKKLHCRYAAMKDEEGGTECGEKKEKKTVNIARLVSLLKPVKLFSIMLL